MTESNESLPLLRRLVGDALREYRTGQGRTLRDVAVAARVSVPYLSEVERGRKEASSEVLAAVCRGLDIRLSDLLEQVRRELVAWEPRPEPSRRPVPVRPAAPAAGATAPARPLAGAHAPGPRPAVPVRPLSTAVPVRLVRAAEQAAKAPPAPAGPTCLAGAAHVPPARTRRRGRFGRPGGLGPGRALAPIVPAGPGGPPARAAVVGRPAAQRVPAHRRGTGQVRCRVSSPAARATVTL
jgi:transcriptional regulator with XRE-family HTH domain